MNWSFIYGNPLHTTKHQFFAKINENVKQNTNIAYAFPPIYYAKIDIYCNAKECTASPITGPRCPEGSSKLRFPDSATMAQDGVKVVSLTHRPPLPPGNAPGTHFC